MNRLKNQMTTRLPSIFNKTELKVFQQLTSPFKIQEFLDSLPYSDEERYRCPRSVLRDTKAHCYDGAVLAAAALRRIGYEPLLVEMLPNNRDDDHILALFRKENRWGAIGKSNFVGLRYREPVYQDLRELIMSYFESYFNIAGERTLVGYTAPLNLNRFNDLSWEINDSAMETIANALNSVRSYCILTPAISRKLTRVDTRSYKAGLLGAKTSGLYNPKK
jgi:hypothetical protein